MGSLEDLFKRREWEADVDEAVDWLSDSGKHGKKESYKWVAEEMTKPKFVEEEIQSSLSIFDVEKAGNKIGDINPEIIPLVSSNLEKQTINKKDELAEKLINELKPSSKGRDSLKMFMKQNDYDLTKLRWHGFIWKGRNAVGFWDYQTGRYITWFPTSTKPSQIKEAEPSERTKPEEIKEE